MIFLRRTCFLLFLLSAAVACGGRNTSPASIATRQSADAHDSHAGIPNESSLETPPDSPTEAHMRAMGLVDIAECDPSIGVSLVYATTDNFMGCVLYSDIRKAFMLPAVADKLSRAQQNLHAQHPGYNLLVYDAARPFAVQKRMWEEAVRLDKTFFVANPAKGGGLHNYGAAVDLTIVDPSGVPLPMGTPFDYFGPEAHTDREEMLVRDGAITQQEFENRRLLRRVMTDAGFLTVISEWWHFNHVRRSEALKTLSRID